MESGDKLLSESIGKIVTVYYNDTQNTVSFKAGKFLDFDDYSLKLLESSREETILIPRSKCIRIELGRAAQLLEEMKKGQEKEAREHAAP